MVSATPTRQLSGMRAFVLVCIGQVVSFLGTSMSQFALAIWAWQQTGSVTALGLVAVFGFAPTVLLSPLAGALVDRWDRKLTMMLSDAGAGLSTLAICLLYLNDSLAIWQLCIATAWAGAFQAFQFPAYSAAISTMLPKAQFGRANGMLSVAESASGIAAPIVAGFLVGIIGIGGVLAFDVVSFLFALFTLALIHIPAPQQTAEGKASRGSLWQESLYGFRYILARPGLLGMQLVFLAMNLLGSFGNVLLTPLVLSRSGNDAQALGVVLAAGSVGALAGGVMMSTWGGPKRRVHGVLLAMALGGLGLMTIGLSPFLWGWMLGAFLELFFMPVLNGSNQSIWQAKVAPDVQGRVFVARRLIAQISAPIGMAAVGPLADFVFEPAMRSESAIARLFGPLFGTAPGAGMALLMTLVGLLSVIVPLSAYLVPDVRYIEDRLPDYVE